MVRWKYWQGLRVPAILFLMALFPALGGCSKTQAVEATANNMPTSDQASEVRTTKPYVLDVGDQLNISVWNFSELSKTVTIENSGDINYPLVGRVKLAGKTLPQAQELLTAKLDKYLVKPQVDINASKARQEVFVLGEVNDPGRITYTRPLTITEALGQAKGFNFSAKKSNVLLVRRSAGKYNVYRVDTTEVLKDQGQMPQLFLQPGDLVYVPPTGLVNLARIMNSVQSIMGPFATAEQMVVLWPQFKNALEGKGVGLSISTSAPTPPSSSSSGVSQ